MDDTDLTTTTSARAGHRPHGPAGARPDGGTRPPGDAPRWPRWVPGLTVGWWLAGAITALTAVLVGRHLPVGASTPDAAGTIVDSVPSGSLTALLATLGLVGAAHAAWMTSRADRPTSRRVRTAAATVTVLVAALGVVFADTSLLARLGYLPVVLVRAPFDPELAGAFDQYVAPAFLLQLGVLVALTLLVVTTVLFVRRSSGACAVCGRLDPPTRDHRVPAPAGKASTTPSGIDSALLGPWPRPDRASRPVDDGEPRGVGRHQLLGPIHRGAVVDHGVGVPATASGPPPGGVGRGAARLDHDANVAGGVVDGALDQPDELTADAHVVIGESDR